LRDPINDLASLEDFDISADFHAAKWQQYASLNIRVLIEILRADFVESGRMLFKNQDKIGHVLLSDEDIKKNARDSFANPEESYDDYDWIKIIDEFALSTLPENSKRLLHSRPSSLIFDDTDWLLCLKLVLTGQWSLDKQPVLRIALGALLLGWFMRLEVRQEKPNSKELDLYLKMESQLNSFCTAELNSEALQRLVKKITEEKSKRRYNGAGKKRKATTREKDHKPVIDLIMKKAAEGHFEEFAGKLPGGLASKIRALIIEENYTQKRKHNKNEQAALQIHPYSNSQIKKMLKRYFSFEEGVHLPNPLKFII
jgi:hypothetical protein